MCSYTEKMRNSSSLFFLFLPQELVTEGLESTLIRNLTDHLGNNLLHCVCSAGHTPLLPVLTSRFGTELTGALSDENRKGLTPVQIAIRVSRQSDLLTISILIVTSEIICTLYGVYNRTYLAPFLFFHISFYSVTHK